KPPAYVKGVWLGVDQQPVAGLEIPSSSVSMRVVIGANGATVSGNVRSSQPDSPQTNVVLNPAGSLRGGLLYRRSAPVDDHGHFQLGGVAPGEYRLYAWGGVTVEDDEVWDKLASHSIVLTVREGDHITEEPELISAEAVNRARDEAR